MERVERVTGVLRHEGGGIEKTHLHVLCRPKEKTPNQQQSSKQRKNLSGGGAKKKGEGKSISF